MFPWYICRICEKQSDLIDISMNSNYLEQYLIMGNVSYDANDGLPQFFCQFCINQLLHFDKFRQKCEETFMKFQDLYMQSKLEVRSGTELNINYDDNLNHNNDDDDVISLSSATTESNNDCDYDDNNALLTVLTYNIADLDQHQAANSKLNNGISSENVSRLNTKNNLHLICEICETKFESMPNLESHMSKFHGMAKNLRQCDQLDLHISKLHTKPYKCENFNETYVKKQNDKKPYKCKICEKCFPKKINLVQHTKTHNKIGPYKCEYCHQRFSIKLYLDVHTRKHTGETPYKCEYCHQCFSQQSTLVLHTRIHTGEKPYKCKYCDKRFVQIVHLDNHLKTHTGEKPYTCEYCCKGYIQKINLISHMKKIHTGRKPNKRKYLD